MREINKKQGRGKLITYWFVTGLFSLGMVAGGLGQLFQAKWNAEGMVHLGYPLYFMSILGAWKFLGVLVVVIPGFTLLKEWAYAGFFFVMSGALITHLAVGDELGKLIAPFILLILIVFSWYIRPANRKIISIN